jgi:tRNA(Ile)-lysidine synthase
VDSFPQAFAVAVTGCLPPNCAGKFCVGFSGGMDSSVVLVAMAELCKAQPGWHLRAVHVNHQLHANSDSWAEHCRGVAKGLAVELVVASVQVDRHHEQGLESAARKARYDALRQALEPGEVLLTAHHADDQAETVLLALLRGSGVAGLAAMPSCKVFGGGWHARPLLSFTRQQLQAFARERNINALDDPANAALRHDRNFLRHQVLPLLQGRWPAAATNMARAAQHVGEAQALLEQLAEVDLQSCQRQSALRIDSLAALPPERRRNVVRTWLRRQGLLMPSTRKLAGLERDLFTAAPDASPRVLWAGTELWWYRGWLYARVPPPLPPQPAATPWSDAVPLTLPANLGQLTVVPSGESAQPRQLSVRFRRDGDRVQLPGRSHRHALKKLLQAHDVLPWCSSVVARLRAVDFCGRRLDCDWRCADGAGFRGAAGVGGSAGLEGR